MGRLPVSVPLSVALTTNPRTSPVLTGEVGVAGCDAVCSAFDNPGELFWRQLRFGQFDVSEMSLASLLITVAAGNTEWTAIPVFPQRGFFHTRLLVDADSGITAPADLAGRRIGVNEYQNTASVWLRGRWRTSSASRPRGCTGSPGGRWNSATAVPPGSPRRPGSGSTRCRRALTSARCWTAVNWTRC